ncbi:MAG: hypothetical protein ACPLZH_00980, partial [Minisyncoccales bacterium]
MLNNDFFQNLLGTALSQLYSFLFFPPKDNELLNFIKISFYFFDFLFLIFIVYFLSKTSFLQWLFLQDLYEFLNYRSFAQKKIKEKWETIRRRLESELEADLKLAVLETTRIFQRALELMGYKGETLEEKINQLPKESVENLNELKGAIRVYKNIIGDPSYRLKKETARQIIFTYEKIF